MHLSVASRSLPPYIALTISTLSRGGVKINVSFYMIILHFDLDLPVEKWLPSACSTPHLPPKKVRDKHAVFYS